MIKNFLCFNQINDTLKIEDQDALLYYLEEIYVRLSKKDKERLSYYKIAKYMNLPTFIAKKTYRNFDKNNSNKVDGEEFIRGMLELFSNDYFILTKSYFDILDYTHCGKIHKDDESLKNLIDTVNDIVKASVLGTGYILIPGSLVLMPLIRKYLDRSKVRAIQNLLKLTVESQIEENK